MYYSTATMPVNLNLSSSIIVSNDSKLAEKIINAACTYFNITREELCSSVRKKVLVRARYIAMYLIHEKTYLDDARVSFLFKRERTMAIVARNEVNKELSLMHTRQQMNIDLRSVIELI